MSTEHIRRASRDRIMSLYQVDPGFYRMIVSRNPSLGRSPTARSFYHSANNGKVPFRWETEPGEPKFGAACTKTTPPISLPPMMARGFTIPNPTSRPTKTGRIHIRIPRLKTVSTKEAKAYVKNKVKHIGRIGSRNNNNNKSSSFHGCSDDAPSSSRGVSKSSWSSSYSNAHKFSDKSGRLLLKVLKLPREIFKWKTKSTTNLTP